MPLVRAAATDVPEPRSQRRPRWEGGVAPRTPTAVATTSGLRKAPVGSPELVQATRRSGLRATPSGRSSTPATRMGTQPGPQQAAVVLGQVHGRHAVEVGGRLAAAGVEQHHADPVGAVHGLGLVDAADPAALADDDASGHPGRVEAAGQAVAGLRRGRARRGNPRGQHQAGRPARLAGGHGARQPEPGRDHGTAPGGAGGAADGGDPRRRVGGVPLGAAVAGGGRPRRRRPRPRRAGRGRRCR